MNSIRLSLPNTRRVRGYTLRRAPLGALLLAIEDLQQFPGELMEKLFPGQSLAEVLNALRGLDGNTLSALLLRAATVAPGMVVRLVARLCDIDEEALLADPAVGADGLMELINAWMELNGIENFTNAVSGLWQRVRKLTAKAGSNG